MRHANRIVTIALLLLVAAPAFAWRGSLKRNVVSIAEAQEYAEIGDVFVLEAEVARADGERIFVLRDASGEMYAYFPDFAVRGSGAPAIGEWVRVAGKLDQEKLNRDPQGIRVQKLERNIEEPARKQSAAPAARPAVPAAPAPAEVQAVTPEISREWVDRLSAARQELLAAEEQLQQANVSYGRALHTAGSKSAVDPGIAARQASAETRVADVRKSIAPMVLEARKAGVSADVLRLYEEMVRPR